MKRSKPNPDPLSLALFGSDSTPDHTPGLSYLQKLAAGANEKAVMLNQPMQSIALRPTNGALTKSMSLLWLKLIQTVQQQEEAQTYKIPMKELVEFIGDTKNYDRLKLNLKALNSIQVEWNQTSAGSEQWAVSSLLSQAKVIRVGNTTTVEISLPPDINKGVREMKQFSALNLLLARELKNPAALNLFRIAVAYETNPSQLTFRGTVAEWEHALRAQPRVLGTEIVYKYFKRDTILPAMAEIARLTHLSLELVEFREGRVVKQLQFKVTPKDVVDLEQASESMAEGEAAAMLKALGLRTTEARALVASYGVARVKRNIDYLAKQREDGTGKIRSRSAYIKAAIQNDYADRDLEVGEVTIVGTNASGTKALSASESAHEIAMQNFQAARRAQAEALFLEMPYRESTKHWETFVAEMEEARHFTLGTAIKGKGLKAKMVQVAFYNWLAAKLLGPIDDKSFLDFLITRQAQAKPAARKRAAKTG